LHLFNPVVDIVCDAAVKETRHLIYDANDLESIAAAMAVLVKRRNELERL
jgi:diacylglycerol kinase